MSGGRGKGTNDENDHLRNKNLRKSIIDNKNTEKRIFVRICFSFYVFKRKEVGVWRKGDGSWERRGQVVGESTPSVITSKNFKPHRLTPIFHLPVNNRHFERI